MTPAYCKGSVAFRQEPASPDPLQSFDRNAGTARTPPITAIPASVRGPISRGRIRAPESRSELLSRSVRRPTAGADERELVAPTDEKRVCSAYTQDDDSLAEATKRQREDITFSGLVYAHQLRVSVGRCIDNLELSSEYPRRRRAIGH